MSDNSSWHYTDRTGAQVGPVSISELKSLISEGKIPTTGLAWTEGMDDWQSFSQIETLKTISVSPPSSAIGTASTTTPAPSATTNPYTPPSAQSNRFTSFDLEYAEYGGIRRLNYFLRNVLLTIGFVIIIAIIVFTSISAGTKNFAVSAIILMIVAAIGFIVLSFLFSIRRLNNIGLSGWYVLFFFVPLVGSILSIALLACPEGYAHHKKLDAPGIVVIVILSGFFVLSLIANIATVLTQ